MKIQDFVQKTNKKGHGYNIRPEITCKDGFKMSVQASAGHYCNPREDNDVYWSMEIGYPSSKEESILEYAEQPELPTDTVYGYVPNDVIDALIEKHGGIDQEKTFSK